MRNNEVFATVSIPLWYAVFPLPPGDGGKSPSLGKSDHQACPMLHPIAPAVCINLPPPLQLAMGSVAKTTPLPGSCGFHKSVARRSPVAWEEEPCGWGKDHFGMEERSGVQKIRSVGIMCLL